MLRTWNLQTQSLHPLTVVILLLLLLLLGPSRVAAQKALDTDSETQKLLRGVAKTEAEIAWAKGHNLYVDGKYLEGLPYLEKAIKLYLKEGTPPGGPLKELGRIYIALGRYGEAEASLRRCAEIQGGLNEADEYLLTDLAQLYQGLGQFDRAEPLLRRSLQLREVRWGSKDHPQVVPALDDLAHLYLEEGKTAKAEPLYRRSLQIREGREGKPAEVASALNNLAKLYLDAGQRDKAEEMCRRSLELVENNSTDAAYAGMALSRRYRALGQHDKAESIFSTSLQIVETRTDRDHAGVARMRHELANLHRTLGQYEKAEPLYRRCLQVQEAQLGKEHPDVAATLVDLAVLYQALGQPFLSSKLMERARRISRRHLSQTLPLLSQQEQLAFLERQDAPQFHAALSLGFTGRAELAQRHGSALWLVNGKGHAQQSLAQCVLLARDVRDSGAGALLRRLVDVRRQLAHLTMAPFEERWAQSRRSALTELTTTEQELSRQLGQHARPATGTDSWIELDQVRKALPRDAVLIEIACFRHRDFKAKRDDKEWGGLRYAAWLIQAAGQGDVQVVDLGEAAKIDVAVQALRDGIGAAQGSPKKRSVIIEKGEAEAEVELQPTLAALAKLILEPLAKHIDDKPQWLISPDGALWLVPWAALPLADGSYAVEKHQISYVISGRDLVAPAFTGKVKHDPPLILADPDFDIEPKEAATLTAKLLGGASPPAPTGDLAFPNFLTTRSAAALDRVVRLPGTAAEAVAIKPKVEAHAGAAPWVYRGKNALEGVFKGFRSPKVVVLSTHGYFLEQQEVKRSDSGDPVSNKRHARDKDGNLLENPLLRCGLLLAGCNERAKATGTQEDGVLTGLEIVGCDLRGTELVVLSACETGLGQVRNGEGVAGLRQAFQLAGAQAVVASLWQVPDRDTAFLMTDFFDGLAKGKSKAEALREAQLARIKAHRDRDGAAHPFFWAAFTLTGR